ncbi:hypothetical protein C7N43_21155 [Sphingobacteriales bacterium UPWRP_1]|nr:hypothetical protein BVG80_16030 [Sphingobacteriales bacterium TSM_CSM]PSJ74982.1 hypothetical protein C7N43_21155 [Sphingobacteriales bacterium UPWRP_1]
MFAGINTKFLEFTLQIAFNKVKCTIFTLVLLTRCKHPNMVARMFKDPVLQSQFDENGFVILPLINEDEVSELKNLFDKIRPQHLKGIYSNIHDPNRANNMLVDQTIGKIFGKHVEELFEDCELGMGTFLVKGTGLDSDSKIHQDWCTVDENHFTSVSIWCPLVNVDAHNGALQVIKGSHRIFNTYRSITIPSIYLEFDEQLEPFLTMVPLKAGECVLYAHNLFHGSKPNYSNEVRVAAVAGIYPRKATLIHYYKNYTENPSEIEVYQIDRNFFYNGVTEFYSGKRPVTLKKIETIKSDFHPLNKEEFYSKLQTVSPQFVAAHQNNSKTKSIWQFFRTLLSNA